MYNATIVQLPKPRVHPNADRLQIFTIMGYQVITSLEYNEGDLGIFFPPDGQVSEEFAAANNLVGYVDDDGNRKGGFMDHKRRVRAINLRGEKSQGLWLPLKSLEFAVNHPNHLALLKVGDELDTVNKHQFCQKYFTQATRSAMKSNRTHTRKETPMFRRHIDTKKLQQQIGQVPLGYNVVITEKVHGTSGRFGRVLEETEYPWWNPMRWFGHTKREWRYLSGTRNVIHRSDEDVQNGFYADNSFRMKAVQPLVGNLRKGEVVYFEIVGWEGVDRPIMPSVNPEQLRDKTFVQKYGKTMFYKYGVPNGECKMIVYRIVMSNEDGVGHDLSWEQVKARCGELGVDYCHEFDASPMLLLHGAKLHDLQPDFVRNKLMEICEEYSSGPSTYDESHMKEGVVVRVETGEPTPQFFKYKSHEFLVLEGHTKNREDYVDLEEIS